MYLRKVHIENIRSIAELDWEIPAGQEAGWHVVIGDNSSGKSTFLRAVSLVLVGMKEAIVLGADWQSWLRKKEKLGLIRLELHLDLNVDDYDPIAYLPNGQWLSPIESVIVENKFFDENGRREE